MSIPEWKTASQKQLIIISNGIRQETFPLQDLFDDVKFYYYNGEDSQNIIKIIWKLRNLKLDKVETLVLSNPVLVTNQYLIQKARPTETIMVEDGSMNYSSFKPSKSGLKKSLQTILGINQDKIFNNIKKTYLFYPSKGSFFFGQIKKLVFNNKIFKINTFPINLNGKRIFVGQPLYNYGYLTLHEYNHLVNKVIEKYNIDFYIPHAFSSNMENMNSKILNLSESNVTLEGLATIYDFEIFSFGSSVLYTCKTINPKIQSNIILIQNNYKKGYEVGFIKSFCDKIFSI